VAVVGVGQELNGDDAAGVKVAQALLKRQRAGSSDAPRPAPFSLLVVEAAHAPENCTGAIRRFAPDLVILVDAAEMGDPPGTVRWLDWREAVGLNTSTHTLPPSMVARYLATELSCEVALVGIQVYDTALGAPVSPAVRRAIRAVAHGLATLLLAPVPSKARPVR
jgi:hydrogenase 3 maturation protease